MPVMSVPSHLINMDFLHQRSLAYCSLLLSSVYHFQSCGHILSSDDKCTVIAVVYFNLLSVACVPASHTKIHL